MYGILKTQSYFKILASILFLVTLSSCGFKPVLSHNYADIQNFKLQVKASDQASTPDITIFKFKTLLDRKIQSLSSTKPYKIIIILSQEFGDISYSFDATVSREQGKLTAFIKIFDDQNQVFESKVYSITSFTKNSYDEFTNQSAVDAAQERLIVQLSQSAFQVIAEFYREIHLN